MKHNYFKDGEYHVCMFCETPLAHLENGKLISNSSKTHVSFLRKNPDGIYTINCCKDCAISQNFKDPALCAEIERAVSTCTELPLGNIDNSFYVIEREISPKERLTTLEKFEQRS
jgi:hypothetical protein